MPIPIEIQLDALLRVALAGLLGGVVGVDREVRRKPAGVRTFAFVAMGSALFTVAGETAFPSPDSSARIVAQVVTGVGFLGAGTILHLRGNDVVGLTTAASVWAVAGVGIACGLGMPVLGLGAAGLLLVALRGDELTRFVRSRTAGRTDAGRTDAGRVDAGRTDAGPGHV